VCSSPKSQSLSGLYVETGEVAADRSVYQRGDLFLYASGCCTWIVGEKVRCGKAKGGLG
jgi:hypothetical protein